MDNRKNKEGEHLLKELLYVKHYIAQELCICTLTDVVVFLYVAGFPVATGPMSESQAERAGLVQTHAYAVLNVVHIKVSYSHNTSCVLL